LPALNTDHRVGALGTVIVVRFVPLIEAADGVPPSALRLTVTVA
jgi:hypothetical protein